MKFVKNPLDKLVYTQKFGENPEVYSQWGMKGHNGVDFRTMFDDTPKGRREVYAVIRGRVSETVISDKGYGKYVRLVHSGGSETIYAHLFSLKVKAEQEVKAGDLLGISNNTGASTGPHLHFGFRPPKKEFNYENGYKGYIDPEPFLI